MNLSEEIVLGFPEPLKESVVLMPENFPSKLGGHPIWLYPNSKPDLKCRLCKGPTTFILQLYAPLNELEECYHRTLHVFACLKPDCQKKDGSVRIYRSQLPQKNSYYAEDAEENLEYKVKEKKAKKKKKKNAGKAGAKEEEESKKDEHEEVESNEENSNEAPSLKLGYEVLSKEYEIFTEVVDEEENKKQFEMALEEVKTLLKEEGEREIEEADSEEEEEAVDEDTLPTKESKKHDPNAKEAFEHEQKLLENYLESEQAKSDCTEEDELMDKFWTKAAIRKIDQAFEFYNEIIAFNKQQILRYCRSELSVPLWFSDLGRFDEKAARACENCGAARVFEFQINSQIANLFKELIEVDWGILCFFSCTKNCASKGGDQPVEELCLMQICSEKIDTNEIRKFRIEKAIKEREENGEEQKPAGNEKGAEDEATKKKKKKKNKKKKKTPAAETEKKPAGEEDDEDDWE